MDSCFLCDICSKTFSKSWGLRLHRKIHLGLKDKHCLYCRKKFSDQKILDEHKAKEHSNGEHSEEFRVEALEMVAEVGIEKAAEELMLHESTLRSWMTSEGKNYCSECHKSFRFQSYLKNHMKLHEGNEGKPVRTFKEKKFSEAFKKQVVEHAKLYSGKSAGQVFGLGESTVRSILKAESFPCNLCERKCAYKRQLERHLLEVHKVEQLIKPEESHQKIFTSFPCNLCERKCAYKAQLKRHLLAVHKVEQLVKPEEMLKIEHRNGEDLLEQSDEPNISGQDEFPLQADLIQCDPDGTIVPPPEPMHENYLSKLKIESRDGEDLMEKSDEPNISIQNEFLSQADLIQYESGGTTVPPSETMHENYFSGDATLDFEIFEQIYGNDSLEDQTKELQDKSPAKELLTDQTEETKTQPKKKRKKKKKKEGVVIQENMIKDEKLDQNSMVSNDIKSERVTKLENESMATIITKHDVKRERNKPSEKTKTMKKYEKRGVTCNVCGVISKEMRRHLVKHTKLETFNCDQCERSFGLNFNLKRHIETTHNPNFDFFHCSKCIQKFTNKANLVKHEIRHKGAIVNTRKIMRERFSCDTCEKVVAGKAEFNSHVKQHLEGKPACEICKNEYSSTNSLKKHKVRDHPETMAEKPIFQCNVCNDLSSTNQKLKRHYAVAHNQLLKKFHCVPCTKSYVDQRHLDIHYDVAHLKLRKYSCHICGKEFGRKSSLTAHTTTVHSGAPGKFACDECPVIYKSKRNLQNHAAKEHFLY